VLYSNGQTHGAVRVEEVIGMIEVERADCRPLPSQFQHEERTWISGTTIYRDQLVLILSPEWILGELGEVVASGAGSQALSAA
jgi:chemotaxis signal transduction protein